MADTKTIDSTQAQNNFGRVLDDVARNRTRYIVKRRGVPQAIVLAFDDFSRVLENESERRQLDEFIRELRPTYDLGEVLEPSTHGRKERPSSGKARKRGSLVTRGRPGAG